MKDAFQCTLWHDRDILLVEKLIFPPRESILTVSSWEGIISEYKKFLWALSVDFSPFQYLRKLFLTSTET